MKRFGLGICLLLCMGGVMAAQEAKFVRQSEKTARFWFELEAIKNGENDYTVSALRVLDRNTGWVHQEFKGLGSSPRSDDALELADVNFDGHKDLLLVEHYPAGPNIPYLVWLYEARAGKFVFSQAFSDISSPELHPRTKTITSDWRDGCCHHGKATYRVIKSRPVLVEEREIKAVTNAAGKERFLFTLSRRVGGKMRIVKSEYRQKYKY